MNHSGIAPFAPLRLQPNEYQDIDHVRTAAMKGTPPAIPPKTGGARNTGFGNNNNNTQGSLLLIVCILSNCCLFSLPIDSFL